MPVNVNTRLWSSQKLAVSLRTLKETFIKKIITKYYAVRLTSCLLHGDNSLDFDLFAFAMAFRFRILLIPILHIAQWHRNQINKTTHVHTHITFGCSSLFHSCFFYKIFVIFLVAVDVFQFSNLTTTQKCSKNHWHCTECAIKRD